MRQKNNNIKNKETFRGPHVFNKCLYQYTPQLYGQRSTTILLDPIVKVELPNKQMNNHMYIYIIYTYVLILNVCIAISGYV